MRHEKEAGERGRRKRSEKEAGGRGWRKRSDKEIGERVCAVIEAWRKAGDGGMGIETFRKRLERETGERGRRKTLSYYKSKEEGR